MPESPTDKTMLAQAQMRLPLNGLKVLDLTIGLRVDAEIEHDGLDGALHGESAYGNAGSVSHQ